MIRVAIDPAKAIIDLSVGDDVRHFELHEHTPMEMVGFVKRMDIVQKSAVKPDQQPLLEVVPTSWESVGEGCDDVLLWLLQKPVEGSEVPDLAWLKQLTLTQRKAVLDTQAKLDSLEEISPNLYAILNLLTAAQIARGLVGDGETNGPGGKSVLESDTSTASSPEKSLKNGLAESA